MDLSVELKLTFSATDLWPCFISRRKYLNLRLSPARNVPFQRKELQPSPLEPLSAALKSNADAFREPRSPEDKSESGPSPKAARR